MFKLSNVKHTLGKLGSSIGKGFTNVNKYSGKVLNTLDRASGAINAVQSGVNGIGSAVSVAFPEYTPGITAGLGAMNKTVDGTQKLIHTGATITNGTAQTISNVNAAVKGNSLEKRSAVINVPSNNSF